MVDVPPLDPNKTYTQEQLNTYNQLKYNVDRYNAGQIYLGTTRLLGYVDQMNQIVAAGTPVVQQSPVVTASPPPIVPTTPPTVLSPPPSLPPGEQTVVPTVQPTTTITQITASPVQERAPSVIQQRYDELQTLLFAEKARLSTLGGSERKESKARIEEYQERLVYGERALALERSGDPFTSSNAVKTLGRFFGRSPEDIKRLINPKDYREEKAERTAIAASGIDTTGKSPLEIRKELGLPTYTLQAGLKGEIKQTAKESVPLNTNITIQPTNPTKEAIQGIVNDLGSANSKNTSGGSGNYNFSAIPQTSSKTKVDVYAEQIAIQKARDEKFFSGWSIKGVENLASKITFGGGKPIEERSWIGGLTQGVIQYPLIGLNPYNWGAQLSSASNKVALAGKGITIQETRKTTASEVFVTAPAQTVVAVKEQNDPTTGAGAANLALNLAGVKSLASARSAARQPVVRFGEARNLAGTVETTPGGFVAVGEGTAKATITIGREVIAQEAPVGYALQGKGQVKPTISGEITSVVTIPEKSVNLGVTKIVTRPQKTIAVNEQVTGGIETIYASDRTSKTFNVGGEKVKVAVKDPSGASVSEPVGSVTALSTVDKNKVFISESRIVKEVPIDIVTPKRSAEAPAVGTAKEVFISDAGEVKVIDAIRVSDENKGPSQTPLGSISTFKTKTQLFERSPEGRLEAAATGKGLGAQEITEFNTVKSFEKNPRTVTLPKDDDLGIGETFGKIDALAVNEGRGKTSATQLATGDSMPAGGASKRLADRGFRILAEKGIRDDSVGSPGPMLSDRLVPRGRKGQVAIGEAQLITPETQRYGVGGVSRPIVDLSNYKLSDVGSTGRSGGVLVSAVPVSSGQSTASFTTKSVSALPQYPGITPFVSPTILNPVASPLGQEPASKEENKPLTGFGGRSGSKQPEPTKPAIVPGIKPIIEPIIDNATAQKPQQKPDQRPRQDVIEVPDVKPAQKPMTDQPRRPTIPRTPSFPRTTTVPPEPVYPLPRAGFGGSSRVKREKYKVLVRRRGKFQELGTGLDFRQAVEQGRLNVMNTAAASFRIETTEGRAVSSGEVSPLLPGDTFTTAKSNRNIIVQKASARIRSIGEKQEISYKGRNRLFGRR